MLKWLRLSAVVLILDQISKNWATKSLLLHDAKVVFESWLNWTLSHNNGVAFSMFNNDGDWQRWFFSALAIAVSILFTVWLKRTPASDRVSACALALVIGGAVGNAVDRIRHGYVIDFIDVYWKSHHWPAFNIADSAICVGAALLILASFRTEPQPKKLK